MARELKKQTQIISLVLLLNLLSLAALFGQDVRYATATSCGIALTPPALKSAFSYPLTGPAAGEEFVIAATITNGCIEEKQPFVAIIEARNSDGVTESLSWQSGILQGLNTNVEVGASWIPEHADNYELRAFIISDLQTPMVLSNVMMTTVEVQETVSNGGTDAEVVEGNNQFAMDFYSNVIASGEQGNIFYSPWSISTAFALVLEGARGQTAEEIQSVFGLSGNAEARRASLASIQNDLNDNHGNYTLNTANALWVKQGYDLSEDYVKVARDVYDSEVAAVDFPSEASRVQINQWVEGKTNNKITELLPPGFLNDLTRLVITNAIYFKGTWVLQFDEKNTAQEDFWLNESESVPVQMMKLAGGYFNYAETDSLQIIELPYQGDKVSMMILLPKSGSGLQDLEKSLTLENLANWKLGLQNQSVTVQIPKFKLKTSYGLKERLEEMGMPTPFSPAADLSGINGVGGLQIQSAVHKAFVEVNEEGTEAAAATAIGIGLESEHPQPPLFRADHPFIFIIQDSESGNILFMGRITNPAG